VVDNELRDFVLGGVALEGEAKTRFNDIQQQLAQLSTKFSNNVGVFFSVNTNISKDGAGPALKKHFTRRNGCRRLLSSVGAFSLLAPCQP
jgi:hypothetical protein